MAGFRTSKRPLRVLSVAVVLTVLTAQAVRAEDAKPPEKGDPAAKDSPVTTFQGTVVDDETGKPVTSYFIQAGRIDSKDPLKITWGFSESRSSGSKDAKYQAHIRWQDGWTARLVADGYLPFPIATKAPKKEGETVKLDIRLKRGRLIRGRVLDHAGKPVADAAVFAIGPTGIYVSAKASVDSWSGKPDGRATPALTDAKGQFEVPAGAANSLAISTDLVDAWEASLPKEGEEALIELPEPGALSIGFQIDGAKETEVFLQMVVSESDAFSKVYWQKKLTIKNGEQLVLKNLPPAKYHVARYRMLRTAQMGMGRMIDRTPVTIVSGKDSRIEFTRPNGVPVKGRVIGLPADVPTAFVFVKPVKEDGTVERFDLADGMTTGKEGEFASEPLLPGKYVIEAEGYPALTPEQQRRTGIQAPRYKAKIELTVPESGKLDPVELDLIDTLKAD